MGHGRAQEKCRGLSRIDARVKLAFLVAYMLLVFNAGSWPALGACAVLAIAAGLAVRMRPRTVLRALVPLATVLVFTVAMQVLYWNGSGTELLSLGPLSVTSEALDASATMLVTLCCVVVASVAFMDCTPTADLTRAFAWLLGPFERLGLRTRGLAFALDVAFAFIPVLVDEFRNVKRAQESRLASFGAGSLRERLSAYQRCFAPLLRSALRRADQLAEAAMSRCLGT